MIRVAEADLRGTCSEFSVHKYSSHGFLDYGNNVESSDAIENKVLMHKCYVLESQQDTRCKCGSHHMQIQVLLGFAA